jgi:hypothetical protein
MHAHQGRLLGIDAAFDQPICSSPVALLRRLPRSTRRPSGCEAQFGALFDEMIVARR